MTNSVNPMVSVVIPTYNESRFLPRCIESVLNQTYNNLEIIVVSDGSTDDTNDVVNSYLATGKVRLIVQNNSGVSRARNNGVNHCSGEYIAFIDSDDAWFPHKLDKQLDVFLKHNDIVLVTTGLNKVNVNGDLLSVPSVDLSYSDKPEDYSHLLLCSDGVIGLAPSSWMLHKKSFDQLNGFVEGIISEDYEFLIRLSEIGRFYIISDALIEYTVRSDSLMRSDNVLEHTSLIDVINLHKNKYSFIQYKKRLSSIYYNWARSNLVANNKGALKILFRSLLYNPFNFQAYVLFVKAIIKGIVSRILLR